MEIPRVEVLVRDYVWDVQVVVIAEIAVLVIVVENVREDAQLSVVDAQVCV